MNIILEVSNGRLIAGIIFGLLFLLLFGVGTIKMIIEVIHPTKPEPEERIKNILVIPIGIFLCCVGGNIMLREYNLLNDYVYVEGVTIKYCYSGRSGKGVEFEYYFNGKRYINCNLHHPITEIKVPGGKFKVRVSEFEPDGGRIDFEQPLTPDSRKYE